MKKLSILTTVCLLNACAVPNVPTAASCTTLLEHSAFLGAYRDACVDKNHDDIGRYDSATYFVGETLFKRQSCLKPNSDAEIERAIAAAQSQARSPSFCTAYRQRAAGLLRYYELQE
ncbi:hypothetical protein [Conchiformibius kuhniae]|uniref:Lipoprotein n=1 Tax=Conchiformibius kuhniae TaxID=211502 RepID=A0A8T9MWQ9_9NEIS|nr:hypothetical protein [Conchiformibius kuhniae]UOP04333.1 hypothetical protein LVJ77_08230 [Conchiformibius kuhniae]